MKFLSEDARNLLALMLKYDPAERITADKALDHRWIKLYDSEEDFELIMKSLTALGKFKT